MFTQQSPSTEIGSSFHSKQPPAGQQSSNIGLQHSIGGKQQPNGKGNQQSGGQGSSRHTILLSYSPCS